MKYGKILSGIAAGTLAGAALGMMIPKRKKRLFDRSKKWLGKTKMWDW